MKFPADGKTMKAKLGKASPRKMMMTKRQMTDGDEMMDSKVKKSTKGKIKHSGSFQGKSNKLGFGGRAAQMKAKGVPGAVIGAIARSKGAAPGQANYHKKK